MMILERVTGGSPVRAFGRGLAAGVIGTAFMTAWQEAASALKKRGAATSTTQQEPDEDPWAHAPAPAQVAKRMLEQVLHKEVHADRIHLLTNVTHWGYGTALGGAYGLVQGLIRTRPAIRGPLFGTGAWAMSYAMLVPMGLYEPPWRYPAKVIAKDLSYHLVFGAGTAFGHELLARRSRR
jgi:hypothetical protein